MANICSLCGRRLSIMNSFQLLGKYYCKDCLQKSEATIPILDEGPKINRKEFKHPNSGERYKGMGAILIAISVVSFAASLTMNNSTIPGTIFFVTGLLFFAVGDLLSVLRMIYRQQSKMLEMKGKDDARSGI